MTEIKRYDVKKASMIGLVRFDEKESGRWVKHDDLAALQEKLGNDLLAQELRKKAARIRAGEQP
ncbi:hypothetical protein VRC37_08360 [Erwinia aphidicola]|uniref:hypothetical protein n=1 Tax=Erwinia aphidicola TaxID=68334 RepID=UPI0030CEBE69